MLVDTIFLKYKNQNKSIREWSKTLGISEKTLLKRHQKGWPVDKVLTQKRIPSNESKKYNYKGKKYTLKELSKKLGLSESNLYSRYKRHGSFELEDNFQRILYKGKKVTIKEAAEKTGIKERTIRDRLKRGLKGKELFVKPKNKKVKKIQSKIEVLYNNKKYSFKELSEKTGIKESTLRSRYSKGLRGKDLLVEKVPTKKNKIPKIYFKIYNEYKKGKTLVALAKKYNKSDSTIRRNFLKLGLKLRDSKENNKISGERAREAVLKNQEKKVIKNLKSSGYLLLESYRGQDKRDNDGNYLSRIRYKIKHECGHVFRDDLQVMPRCPKCFGLRVSKEEEALANYIEKTEKIERNKKIFLNKDGHRKLEADIIIPHKKIIFEYNGLWWHHSRKHIHKEKTDQAIDKGYKLYHLWSHWGEEKNKSFIDQKLGRTNKIYARKTVFREITGELSKDFFEKNHLDGYAKASFSFGLYLDDNLIQVISYRYHKEGLEIARFATKRGYSVVGGFSKIFKNSLKHLPKKNIITYNNRDITPNWEESVYFKSGFDFIGDSGPILFYTDGLNTFSRESLQKHKLKKLENYSDKKTADEILAEHKIFPVWNSGNFKYIFKNDK